MKVSSKLFTLFTLVFVLSSCGPGANPITETRKPKNQNRVEDSFADKAAESSNAGAEEAGAATGVDSKDGGAAGDSSAGEDSEMASDDSAAPGLKESENSEMLITEYVDGKNGEAALELTNISGRLLELSDYQITKIEDTGKESTYNFKAQEIKKGVSIVICSDKNNLDPNFLSKCSLKIALIEHDGNDAYKLTKSSLTGQTSLIDSFGNNKPPASEWTSQSSSGVSYSSKESVLRRKCNIKTGDKDFSDAFLPHIEWDQYKSDDYSNLGKWDCN